jgi:XisI protein
MDKITRYQEIISNFLTEYVKDAQISTSPNVHPRLLLDTTHNSFQLTQIGWNKDEYVLFIEFHFDIIDGKIWLQCNNTEWEVDTILIEKGVAKEDIVIGFLPPYYREIAKTAA